MSQGSYHAIVSGRGGSNRRRRGGMRDWRGSGRGWRESDPFVRRLPSTTQRETPAGTASFEAFFHFSRAASDLSGELRRALFWYRNEPPAVLESFFRDWRRDWFDLRIAPSGRVLGDEAIAAGAKGILFLSAQVPGGRNPVLYVGPARCRRPAGGDRAPPAPCRAISAHGASRPNETALPIPASAPRQSSTFPAPSSMIFSAARLASPHTIEYQAGAVGSPVKAISQVTMNCAKPPNTATPTL